MAIRNARLAETDIEKKQFVTALAIEMAKTGSDDNSKQLNDTRPLRGPFLLCGTTSALGGSGGA
jgi:hypothetical protein